MNVSLRDARSQARLNWDLAEEQRRSTQTMTFRVFLVALVVFAGYMLWKHVSG